jgi:hypothetical protein
LHYGRKHKTLDGLKLGIKLTSMEDDTDTTLEQLNSDIWLIEHVIQHMDSTELDTLQMYADEMGLSLCGAIRLRLKG